MGYIVRRFLATLPVMAVVAVVVFLLIHLSPGDPAALIAGDLATAEDIAKLRVALGLDLPLWQQFGIWLSKLFTGDLGTSIFTQVPVSELLAQRIEPTLSIAALTMGLTLLVAVPLGTLAAHRAGTWIDRLVMLFAVLAFSVPVFLVGYLLVYAFAIQLPWFPVQGYARLADGAGAWLRSLVLPCVNLALVYIALITRMTRATVLEVLHEDYIRTARAKGLPEGRVRWGHAFSNALAPVLTILALSFGGLFSGALITESMFAWPGMGATIYQAIQTNDFNLALVGLLLATFMTMAGNLLADIALVAVDPRVSLTDRA